MQSYLHVPRKDSPMATPKKFRAWLDTRIVPIKHQVKIGGYR